MTIRKRIEHITEFAAAVNAMKWDNPLRDGQDKMLWQRIDALQVEIGGGLVPGRHLRWNVADGYAHYLVVKVNKRDVELVHLDYTWMGIGFRGVGRMMTGGFTVPVLLLNRRIGGILA